MTISAAPDGRGGAALPPHPEVSTSEVPVRAGGVELIGEMRGSGYKHSPALVRRADGQMVQLTPLLYLVLGAVDGRRTHAEIAQVVSRSYGSMVSADNVAKLVDSKLRPLGLLLKGDGSEPELKKSNPLLGLQFKYAVTDPAKTRRLTASFAALFNPFVVAAVLGAFLAISWWVLFDKGLASAAHEAFHKPALLLLIFVVTVLSAGFHEFGHAAAARRGGSTPGTMGVGLYLFWPAFYTDVTDSYRLGRGGRLRTDLGGLYFNAIVAVAVVGIWWVSAYDALLLVVATQILQMLRQLTPLIRFDGYHVLADLTGVPDLYHRIKPVLLGVLPWRWRDPEATALKPWARAVVTLWVLIVVPMLAFALLMMVLTLPRLLATAWVSLQEQWATVERQWDDGDMVSVLAHLLSIVALVLPIFGVGFILIRLLRQVSGSVWRRTAGRPVRRAVAITTAAAIAAGLGWVWWPDEDTYRPIAAYEQGTLTSALARPPAELGEPLGVGDERTVQTVWPNDLARPTRAHPQLALVMVPVGTGVATPVADPTQTADPTTSADPTSGADPTDAATAGSGASPGDSTPDATPSETAPGGNEPATGIFPFDLPLPPGVGDTQALAVNTTDDTVVYDVAFALVWVDDDDVVTNTNEAFAAASCTNCAAVAVSFQVVLIMSDADVIVPANLATAVNYECVECLTFALASQLVITLDGPLSDESMAALQDLWTQIAAFAAGITSVPLGELQDILAGFQDQILDIIESDPSSNQPATEPAREGGATTSPSNTPTDQSSSDSPADPSDSPSSETPSESTAPSPSSTPTLSDSTTPTPTASGSPSSTPTPSPSSGSPTPSGETSPTASATP